LRPWIGIQTKRKWRTGFLVQCYFDRTFTFR